MREDGMRKRWTVEWRLMNYKERRWCEWERNMNLKH